MYKVIALLVVLLHALTCTSAVPKCCDRNNVAVSPKECVDGAPLKRPACEKKFIQPVFEPNSTLHVDDKDYLVYEHGDPVPPDEYCLTFLESMEKEVYLVCYEDDSFEDTARSVNVVLGFISIFFIILTIVSYLLVPQLMDVQGICLIQSISGLAFAFLIVGIIQLSGEQSTEHCHLLAYLMYISFLYAFFWLNILSFHIWRLIVNPKILKFTKNWLMIYHIFGIGGPLCLLAFLLTAHYSDLPHFDNIRPGIGDEKCWFTTIRATFIYFYGPITALICLNIIYFIWTSIVLWKQMKHCTEKKAKVLKYRLCLCAKLFFIMGITWVFEVLSAVFDDYKKNIRWIWVITDALNGLQGLFIFLLLVVCRKKVLRALANKKIFTATLPASWKNAQDDECDELEEEMSLSEVEEKKGGIETSAK